MKKIDTTILLVFCGLAFIVASIYVLIQRLRKFIKRKPAHRHKYTMRCVCGKERFKSLDRKDF